MVDFIIGGVILVLVAAAIVYIVKQKKAGVKCVGCPEAGRCHSGSCHSCHSEQK